MTALEAHFVTNVCILKGNFGAVVILLELHEKKTREYNDQTRRADGLRAADTRSRLVRLRQHVRHTQAQRKRDRSR